MTICDPTSPANPCDVAPLEQDLVKLREALITSQQQQQTAEINIRQNDARIRALEALIGEFNTIITRYRERYQQLKDKQDNLAEHCEKERACFLANLGDALAKRIIETSNEVYEKLKQREEDLKSIEEGCSNKKKELATLRAQLEEARARFEQLRTLDAAIEARHRICDTQKQAVQTERDAHNYNVAFYLLVGKNKFCPTVNDTEPKLLTVDDLCRALKSAWAAYKEKDEKYNEKDAEVQACERAVATLRAQLEQDKRDVETVIRRKLAQLGAPAAASAY